MAGTQASERTDDPGLRDRKKAETRESIYEAAVALFRRRGYDDTSMDEIARRARVSRGTVFNYFGAKRALLEEYRRRLEEGLRAMEERLRDRRTRRPGSRRRVERFFAELASRAQSEGAIYRSLVRQVLTQRSEQSGEEERARRVAASLAIALGAGRERGELRGDLDTELAAYTLLRLWSSALVEWASTDGRTPLKQRVQEMVGLLFDGLEARGPVGNG